jgi:hypothetical protein
MPNMKKNTAELLDEFESLVREEEMSGQLDPDEAQSVRDRFLIFKKRLVSALVAEAPEIEFGKTE